MHLYGLIIGIAIVIGINYFEKHQVVIPKNRLAFFEISLIISAIIGARAYHVADQWQFYSQNPWLIPQTWNGGLGIFGAIVGALTFIFLYSLVSSFSFLVSLNSITPILPLCQAIGRLGNWANHENPIWWPEAIGDLLIFWFIQKYPASPTAKYMIGYGIIRLATEFWRTDTWQTGTIKVGQIISIIFVIVGILIYRHERHQIPHNHPQKHPLDA